MASKQAQRQRAQLIEQTIANMDEIADALADGDPWAPDGEYLPRLRESALRLERQLRAPVAAHKAAAAESKDPATAHD